MSKEIQSLKALKKDVEEAEAQHNKFRDEVLCPLLDAHPKIIGRWMTAWNKVRENYSEFVLPKVDAHARAKYEAMFRAAETQIQAEMAPVEAEEVLP